MSCNICVENFDDAERAEIKCPFCNEVACCACYQEYIGNSTHTDVHCMHCRKVWLEEFVQEVFPTNFVKKDLRKHKEKLWIAQEKVYLPLAQPFLIKEREIEKLKEDMAPLQAARLELLRQLDKVEMELGVFKEKIALIKESEEKEIPKAIVVRNCPVDNCRGFLNEENVCGICDTLVCKKCRVPLRKNDAEEEKGKNKKHKCKKEDVESVALIEKETKPCPKCGVRISKTSGCDQMWCVNCHTAFSWNTGAIEKGLIHNPLFFAWQKKNGGVVARNPNDLPCGGFPQLIKNFTHRTNEKFSRILMQCLHIQGTRARAPPVEKDPMDLRVKFLKDEIDEKKWASMLTKRKKAHKKLCEFYELDRAFLLASIDLFRKAVVCKTDEEGEQLLVEFKNLREFYNSSSTKLSERYNCVHILISQKWMDERAMRGEEVKPKSKNNI